MEAPDAYIVVVGIGIFLVFCADIGTWACGCFNSRITRIAYGPFQSDPPTRMYRAYTTSKLIMCFSSIIMYVVIYTEISPSNWSWMTILHGSYFFFHLLWVPAVRLSVSRDVKWIAVAIVWLATLSMLGILILLWVDNTHAKKSETDIRVAISACTLIFFHHLFWDSYVWSCYYDPRWNGEQTMPCTMPAMTSVNIDRASASV